MPPLARNAQPLAAFTALVDEELAKAKAMVDKGTPRAKVYAKTIANGETGPKTAPAAAKPAADKVYNIPVPKKAPTKGAAKAKAEPQRKTQRKPDPVGKFVGILRWFRR